MRVKASIKYISNQRTSDIHVVGGMASKKVVEVNRCEVPPILSAILLRFPKYRAGYRKKRSISTYALHQNGSSKEVGFVLLIFLIMFSKTEVNKQNM